MRALADLDGPGRLLNDYSWGGYLIWSLGELQPVFIDGRADVYGDRILRDYADMVSLAPGWRDRLEAYAIDRVLLPPATPLVQALQLSGDWAPAYSDKTSLLLVRRSVLDPGVWAPGR